jgi:hypothetical protein
VANTSGSLLTAERATQERLLAQIHQLELDNRSLRDDLGFFEKLIPASSVDDVAIRGLQAEILASRQLRWQVLVIQPVKSGPEFKGGSNCSCRARWTASPGNSPCRRPGAAAVQAISASGGPGRAAAPGGGQAITARILNGNGSRAVQSLKL